MNAQAKWNREAAWAELARVIAADAKARGYSSVWEYLRAQHKVVQS